MALIFFDHVRQEFATQPKLSQYVHVKNTDYFGVAKLQQELATVHDGRIVYNDVNFAYLAAHFALELFYSFDRADIFVVEIDSLIVRRD